MVNSIILDFVKEQSKQYQGMPGYDDLCEEHTLNIEFLFKKFVLMSRFNDIKIKHGLIFPQVSYNSVNFSIKTNGKEHHRYMYIFLDNQWKLITGLETPESKSVMDDLIRSEIITTNGLSNYNYGWD